VNRRVVASGTAVAAVAAGIVAGVALASPTAGSTATNGPSRPTPAASSSIALTPTDPGIVAAAAQLGVSPQRLLDALPAVKQASAGALSDDAGSAALATQLGVSRSAAQRALTVMFGSASHLDKSGRQLPPDAVITSLAHALGVSTEQAQQVWDELNRLSRPGHGVDPTSTEFGALASSLGKTPQQLAHALDAWKRGLAATMPTPSPS